MPLLNNNYGPLLMGLGAGIASGNTWGEGIGRGLQLAQRAQQQQQDNMWRQKAFDADQAHRGATLGMAQERLGLARTAAERAQQKYEQDLKLRQHFMGMIAGQPGAMQGAPAPAVPPAADPSALMADDAVSAMPMVNPVQQVMPPQANPAAMPQGDMMGNARRNAAFLAASGDYAGATKMLMDAQKNSPAYLRQKALIEEQTKADVKREAEMPHATARAQAAIQKASTAAQMASDLFGHQGLDPATGVIQGRLPTLFNQDAADFDTEIDTLKTKVFVSAINEMRELSKTGGALGQVTEREIEKMENSMRNLQQTQREANMRSNLAKLTQDFNESMQRISDAYQQTYGQPMPFTPVPVPQAGQAQIPQWSWN